MRLSQLAYRRVLFISAAILVVVALVLVLVVIPPVRIEASTGATTERAVQAFWGNVVLHALFSLTITLMAFRSEGRTALTTTLHVVLGAFVVFLGLALADAGSAYGSHGPSMQSASSLLVVCAVADLVTGALVVATPFLRSKRSLRDER
jgi:hypothetical protein